MQGKQKERRPASPLSGSSILLPVLDPGQRDGPLETRLFLPQASVPTALVTPIPASSPLPSGCPSQSWDPPTPERSWWRVSLYQAPSRGILQSNWITGNWGQSPDFTSKSQVTGDFTCERTASPEGRQAGGGEGWGHLENSRGSWGVWSSGERIWGGLRSQQLPGGGAQIPSSAA